MLIIIVKKDQEVIVVVIAVIVVHLVAVGNILKKKGINIRKVETILIIMIILTKIHQYQRIKY